MNEKQWRRWLAVGKQHLVEQWVDGREADELRELQLLDHLEAEVLDERQEEQ